jgi:hypothetical protein
MASGTKTKRKGKASAVNVGSASQPQAARRAPGRPRRIRGRAAMMFRLSRGNLGAPQGLCAKQR